MKSEKIFDQLISFFVSPNFPEWFLPIKIFFVLFGFFFLGYIIWGIFFTSFLKRLFLWDLKEFFSFKPYYTKKFLSQWKKIEKRILSGIEADFKLAILEADELVNNCLTTLGYSGKNLEEKFEKLNEETISNLKDLKFAHQIRNDIIEDPSYKISLEETKKILTIYEKALKDLQVI